MPSDESDLELLKRAALEAGRLAERFFRRNPNTWTKEGGSPVSEADIAVDRHLRTMLVGARPDYGWLSEESADDPSRRQRAATFVVDPIDGTRAFIEGSDLWCVSLAVVVEGRPVVAALSAPARGEIYVASRGGGAWMGECRLSVSDWPDVAGARIGAPRGWLRTETIRGSGAHPQAHIPSLAYRFAQVAANRLDAAFAGPRAHDWDLAASHLLVHEAGGRLTELDGLPPRYNREVLQHGVLVATNSSLHAHMLATVENASREVARGRRA